MLMYRFLLEQVEVIQQRLPKILCWFEIRRLHGCGLANHQPLIIKLA